MCVHEGLAGTDTRAARVRAGLGGRVRMCRCLHDHVRKRGLTRVMVGIYGYLLVGARVGACGCWRACGHAPLAYACVRMGMCAFAYVCA